MSGSNKVTKENMTKTETIEQEPINPKFNKKEFDKSIVIVILIFIIFILAAFSLGMLIYIFRMKGKLSGGFNFKNITKVLTRPKLFKEACSDGKVHDSVSKSAFARVFNNVEDKKGGTKLAPFILYDCNNIAYDKTIALFDSNGNVSKEIPYEKIVLKRIQTPKAYTPDSLLNVNYQVIEGGRENLSRFLGTCEYINIICEFDEKGDFHSNDKSLYYVAKTLRYNDSVARDNGDTKISILRVTYQQNIGVKLQDVNMERVANFLKTHIIKILAVIGCSGYILVKLNNIKEPAGNCIDKMVLLNRKYVIEHIVNQYIHNDVSAKLINTYNNVANSREPIQNTVVIPGIDVWNNNSDVLNTHLSIDVEPIHEDSTREEEEDDMKGGSNTHENISYVTKCDDYKEISKILVNSFTTAWNYKGEFPGGRYFARSWIKQSESEIKLCYKTYGEKELIDYLKLTPEELQDMNNFKSADFTEIFRPILDVSGEYESNQNMLYYTISYFDYRRFAINGEHVKSYRPLHFRKCLYYAFWAILRNPNVPYHDRILLLHNIIEFCIAINENWYLLEIEDYRLCTFDNAADITENFIKEYEMQDIFEPLKEFIVPSLYKRLLVSPNRIHMTNIDINVGHGGFVDVLMSITDDNRFNVGDSETFVHIVEEICDSVMKDEYLHVDEAVLDEKFNSESKALIELEDWAMVGSGYFDSKAFMTHLKQLRERDMPQELPEV